MGMHRASLLKMGCILCSDNEAPVHCTIHSAIVPVADEKLQPILRM